MTDISDILNAVRRAETKGVSDTDAARDNVRQSLENAIYKSCTTVHAVNQKDIDNGMLETEHILYALELIMSWYIHAYTNNLEEASLEIAKLSLRMTAVLTRVATAKKDD